MEAEISARCSGPLSSFVRSPVAFPHLASSGPGRDEFVLEAERDLPKVFGFDYPPPETHQLPRVKALFDKAIVCLRTFKSGPVGYGAIEIVMHDFHSFGGGAFTYGDHYVPYGEYHLKASELAAFRQYATLFFVTSEPTMGLACRRLADAGARTRADDKLVDAVIGMEALLLAGIDDRKTELRYRFGLNYSSVSGGSAHERSRAFRMARDLYDRRSEIAHGSVISNELLRVGDERLTFLDAANRATESLRRLIQHFLPIAASAPYKQARFWDEAYFGLFDADTRTAPSTSSQVELPASDSTAPG